MDCQPDMDKLRQEWKDLLAKLEPEFGEVDLQGILFLIGVQELGKGAMSFSKDEKQDLMHIATCRLMSRHGYYELSGKDNEGWPVWIIKSRPPAMKLKEQDLLLKQAVIEYFREAGFII